MNRPLLASKVVIEEEGPRIRRAASLSLSTAGAVGVTERGPLHTPTLCSSFEEFTQTFGAFTPSSDLALAAWGFFENGGGALWVVRTTHHTNAADPTTATVKCAGAILQDGAGHPFAEVFASSPGTHAHRLEVLIAPHGNAFDVFVVEEGTPRETFAGLSGDVSSPDYFVRRIQHAKSGSRLVRVADRQAKDVVAELSRQTVSLAGGDDGLVGLADADFIGSDATKTGLRALDAVQDLGLVMIPGRTSAGVYQALAQYCEIVRGGETFAILDPPANSSAVEMVAHVERSGVLNLSEYAALYWPRINIRNPAPRVFGNEDVITACPSGAICGVYARNDASDAGGIYEAPAGIENGRLFGVLGLETHEALEEAKRDIVYPKRINPLTTGPGMPFFIDGSRTLRGDGNYGYINERRGVIFIERSLQQRLQFLRHRHITPRLQDEARRTCVEFLTTQTALGAFASDKPARAFDVQVRSAGSELIVDVGLAVSEPGEFIRIRISPMAESDSDRGER